MAQDFLTYQQAAVRLGSPEAVRQAVITRSLPAYVELNGVSTREFDPEGDWLPRDGETMSSSWRQVSVPYDTSDPDTHEYGGDPEDFVQIVHYELSGWFRLAPSAAQTVARNRDGTTKLTTRLEVAEKDTPTPPDTVPQVLEEVTVTTRLSELYFRGVDVETLLSGEQAGGDARGMAAHSSNTKILNYLKMIRALAVAAKVSAPSDTPRVVDKLRELGFETSDPNATARVLDAARTFTKDAYEDARILGENTYQFDHAVCLSTIRALIALSQLPATRSLAALKRKLLHANFKGSLPSDGTCRHVINKGREFTA